MRIKLHPLLSRRAGREEVEVRGRNLREALQSLLSELPDIKEDIFDENDLRPYIFILLNGEIISDLDLPLKEEDLIEIGILAEGG